jgi:hypothetical protein
LYWYWPLNGSHTAGWLGRPQSGGGLFEYAARMKMPQIVAGKVPPATRIPWTAVIGIFAFW